MITRIICTLLLLIPFRATCSLSVLRCNADPTGKADSSVAFAECLHQIPIGELKVPSGRYLLRNTVILNRNQTLAGDGAMSSVINCQVANSPCLIAADNRFGPNNYSNSEISSVTLDGNPRINGSIGLFLGGDPEGKVSPKAAFADGFSISSARITGFDKGIVWGENAFGNKINRSAIFGNGTGLFVLPNLSNSGEAIGITDSGVFNNAACGIEDRGNLEWFISDSGIDYNQTAFCLYGATVQIAHSHLEQRAGHVFFQPFGVAVITMRDSEIILQNPTGDDECIFDTWPQDLILTLDNVSIWSNHRVRYLLRDQHSVRGTVTNLHGNGNRKIEAFSNTSRVPDLQPATAF